MGQELADWIGHVCTVILLCLQVSWTIHGKTTGAGTKTWSAPGHLGAGGFESVHAQRTLTRYYVYAIINGLQFGWTTWLAFVLLRSGNPGWGESAFHLAILLGEVPTGIVADRVGRRVSMLIGLSIGAIASFSFPFIDGTLTACLALGLWGFGSTFLSGADTALLYETAMAVGGSDFARKAMARASGLQFGALAAAPIIAGLLYQQHVLAPFLTRGLLSVVGVGIVWGMSDRYVLTPREHQVSFWSHTATAVQLILRNRTVLGLILFSWAYNTVGAMVGQYGQAYFPFIGYSMAGAGVIFALARVLSAGGSQLAERIRRGTALRLLTVAPAVQALGYLVMGLGRSWLGGVWYVLADGLDGVISPTLQHQFNEAIPSEQRATLLSFQSAGFSMLMVVVFPAASYLRPLSAIYVVTGAAGVCVGVVWALFRLRVPAGAATATTAR